MENFNLNLSQMPQMETNPEAEAMINALSMKIFEDDVLKCFALVKKVDMPVGLISFLDFVETDDVIEEQNNGSFCTPLLDVEAEPMKVMGLKLFNKAVEQKTYQVSASLTREMIRSLKELGIDAAAQTESILINEAKQGIFKEVLQIIDGFAETSYRKTWTKEELRKEKRTKWIHKHLPFLEKWLPTIFKGIYKKQVIIKNDVQTETAIRMIVAKILGACNRIAINSRRGSGNVVITNCQIGTILQDSPGFVQTPMYGEVSMQNPCGPYMMN